MPKKKTKKPVTKKIPAKKKVKRSNKSSNAVRSRLKSSMRAPIRKGRIGLVVKNLLLFAILFLISVVIATASRNEIVDQLFWIIAILTAFVAVALLIVLLIFVFMAKMKK